MSRNPQDGYVLRKRSRPPIPLKVASPIRRSPAPACFSRLGVGRRVRVTGVTVTFPSDKGGPWTPLGRGIKLSLPLLPVKSPPRHLALSRPNRYVWAWPRPSDDCCRERRLTGNRPVPGVDEQSIRTRNSDLRGVRPMVEMLWPGPAGGCSGGLFVIQCGPEVPEQRGTGLETNRTEARL